MIEIDGSYGEGGGQVLRTALTLATLTGQPVRIYNVRARRSSPGLRPQHLTGITALARACQADVRGAALKSTEVEFYPRTKPVAGEYAIDVTDAAQGGSAGAVTLILQSLLLPLALADGVSDLTLRGGTHVPWSPSFHYLAHVFLPAVARMGVQSCVKLDAWGFYPVGGGQISAAITPTPAPPPSQKAAMGEGRLTPLTLMERGPLKRVWGVAVASNLPAHIPQRMADRARNLLADAGVRAEITAQRERGAGPGAGLFLLAEYEHVTSGFASLGERGKSSEQVAEEACLDLLAYRATDAPVDMHLADQLLLPMALASGQSEFRTCRVTQHLLTNAQVIRQFVPAQIEIGGQEGGPGTVVVNGTDGLAE